jgi:hypothetical protein
MEGNATYHDLDHKSALDAYQLSSSSTSSEYETGFLLFLVVTCTIGIIFALVVGCNLIGEPKRWYIDDDTDFEETQNSKAVRLAQVGLLLAVGGGAALVVWGSFVRAFSTQTSDNSGAANGLACILFGAAAVVFTYPWLVYGMRRDFRTNVLLAATYFLLLPGWILLAITVQQKATTSEYEFMTMEITNSRAQYEEAIECSYDETIICRGFRGQIEVHWSSDSSSCPYASPGLSCQVWSTDPTCDQYTHSGDVFIQDEVSAKASVAECTQERYNLLTFGEEISDDNLFAFGGEESENNQVVLDQGLSSNRTNIFETDSAQGISSTTRPTTNTVDAYGSCSSSCKAALVTSDDIVAKMTSIGFGMSIAGSVVVLLVGLRPGIKRRDGSGNKEGKDYESGSTSSMERGEARGEWYS